MKILFLIGMYRSGTSWLYSLLDSNPQISLLYEADIFIQPKVVFSGRRTPWFSQLETWHHVFSRHSISFPDLVKGSVNARDAACWLYQQKCADDNSVLFRGEKSALYFTCISKLSRLFPQAKFIFLERNPKEVLLSVLKAAQTDRFFNDPLI